MVYSKRCLNRNGSSWMGEGAGGMGVYILISKQEKKRGAVEYKKRVPFLTCNITSVSDEMFRNLTAHGGLKMQFFFLFFCKKFFFFFFLKKKKIQIRHCVDYSLRYLVIIQWE